METTKVKETPLYERNAEMLDFIPSFTETICRIAKDLSETAMSILLNEFPEVAEEENRAKCEYGFCPETNQYSFFVFGVKVAEWSIEMTGRSISLVGPTFFATHDYVLELLSGAR